MYDITTISQGTQLLSFLKKLTCHVIGTKMIYKITISLIRSSIL